VRHRPSGAVIRPPVTKAWRMALHREPITERLDSMLLTRVSLTNFRAFRRAEIRIPQAGLVLIAGANNAGKTALLSALDVIGGNSGDITSVRHAGADGPAQVMGTFSLTQAEQGSLGTQLRDDELPASVDFVFAQREALRIQGHAELGLTEIRGNWPLYATQVLARLTTDSPGTPSAEVLSLLNGGAVPPATDTIRFGGGPMWLDELLRVNPRTEPLGRLLDTWRPRFYHFRALRTGGQRAQNLASSDKLEPTGTNLSAVLLYLATDLPVVFDQLRDLIAEIVPHIGRLEVRTGGGQLRVVFDGPSGDLNLKDLGTGVEQLLMTLVVGLMEAPPFTLVVEEPETNLHPSGQRALLGHLQRWAEDRQIIAATHSPVMLNWSPGGDRLWHVTRSEDDSHVAMVNADPLPLLEALGVHLADILSADRVLVLEGPSDQDVLVVWFPEVLRSPRVAVLYGEGGDNARHADQLAEWLAGTDRAGLKRVLYLRDRDELSTAALRKLSSSPTVYLLERRELENYLLAPEGIVTALGSMELQDNNPPTTEEVVAVMNYAAESLRRKIVVNRVCRQIGPSQPLVGHKLRQELANAGADMEQITASVLSRMMTADDLRTQINELWTEAERDVARHQGEQLLAIAPGEEILDAIFLRFASRSYDKRRDGSALANSTPPPAEIDRILTEFMAD